MIDKSPNGNDWSPDNCNTEDSMLDTPSNNFATLRMAGTPAASGSGLTEGNLEFTTGTTGSGGNSNRLPFNTISPTSGKWYVEVHPTTTNLIFIGVHPYQVGIVPTGGATRWQGLYSYNGEDYLASTSSTASNSTYAASYGQPDIIGIYMDMDASPPQVYFSKNGQWANGSGSWNQSTPTGAITLGGTFFTTSTGGFEGIGINIRSASSSSNTSAQVNFGQDSTFSGFTAAGGYKDSAGIGDFKYPVPANALAICSANLPITTPSIINPEKHFKCVTYTGNASTQKINLGFKPDMIWFKSRQSSSTFGSADSVRGASKLVYQNTSQAEETSGSGRDLASFDDDGFTLGNPQILSSTNGSGLSIVAWCWKAGGAAVSNTDGDQTTQVSVNEKAGFSIVTYTGTGSNTNIGHGLGATPNIVITKSRSTTGSWAILDTVGNSSAEYGLFLNDNGGYSSYQGGTYWNDTLPTSTVFRVSSNAATNASGVTYVAYCWTSIPGFSKFGKYTGNGSNDGTFVYTGFRPAWVTVKQTNASNNWQTWDSARESSNVMQRILEFNDASTADDASSNTAIDFLSNGFKHRTSFTRSNDSGDTYIYMAFCLLYTSDAADEG